MRFDLHIHSCLSGCASLEMSPRTIATLARRHGLAAIGLTDHNSALNAPAMADACAEAGIALHIGLEVTTREEVHVLCLFDQPETALELGRICYARLPDRPNRPERFGDQAVVNTRNEVLDLVPRMLQNAVDLPLADLAGLVKTRNGLLIAAHIDRPQHSVISQLGFIPPEIDWDAVEVSIRCDDRTADRLAHGHPWIRGSDAHLPDQIGQAWNEAELDGFSLPALRRALREGRVVGRRSPNP